MNGKAPPNRRGRGRGRGGGGSRDRSSSAPYPSSSSDKGSSSTTLCLEGIPSSISKRDIISALGNFALEVSTVSFQPVRNQVRIEFKGRRGAEGAFQKNLGSLTVAGTKYSLSWETADQTMQIILPPPSPPPNGVPQMDSFARNQPRGLGRGTYDPQFRQVGHFMDTSQLVVGPEERGKIKGKVNHVV
ncbi:uncharacterized protein LOC110858988 [Folsomia candida]|uniref:Pre-mRNA-splicing factor RBM22 n=1 Tax=Folsomia candida TaxID=158441 RepID=A0A226DC09_FOLCA|nr:uncharacterized protein LOC110858988 [Folsomia candida]OXA43085.1 Pre-mRNA-splicing factor RBM22 [Folsomia candida]